MQAPDPDEIERRQVEFDRQAGNIMERIIPEMHVISGQIHSLAFPSPAMDSADLSCKEMLSARSSLEVPTLRSSLQRASVYASYPYIIQPSCSPYHSEFT